MVPTITSRALEVAVNAPSIIYIFWASLRETLGSGFPRGSLSRSLGRNFIRITPGVSIERAHGLLDILVVLPILPISVPLVDVSL